MRYASDGSPNRSSEVSGRCEPGPGLLAKAELTFRYRRREIPDQRHTLLETVEKGRQETGPGGELRREYFAE